MSRPDSLGCVAGTLCVGGPVPTQFGWYLTFMTVFVVALYLYVCKRYPAEAAYVRVPEAGEEEDNLEQRKCGAVRGSDNVHGFTPLEIEV